MRPGWQRAVRLAYRGQPRATRLHVRLRLATSPVAAVVDRLPAEGRILDWGGGHGAVGLAALQEEFGRRLVITDLDPAKLRSAAAAFEAAGVADRAEVRHVSDGAVPTGPWEGIVVSDVLYLLDVDAQRRAVVALADALAPGGVLVLKEMARRPRAKWLAMRAQEQVAVRLARITASAGGLREVVEPEVLASWCGARGLRTEVVALDRRSHVPHVAVVARRPPSA